MTAYLPFCKSDTNNTGHNLMDFSLAHATHNSYDIFKQKKYVVFYYFYNLSNKNSLIK